LLFEVVEDHIAVIRFNRPEARNAVNVEITEAMTAAVERTESDPNIRVVVLGSSTPGMFCAGADLKLVAAGRADDMRPGDGGFAGLVDATRAKPWIAAVEGPAMGGGFEICLACDLIVAAEGSRFALPEVKRGLIAGAGGIHRAGRVLPRNIALELVTTGEPISGARAEHFGMVNRLVPNGQALDAALELARAIIANAPIGVQESLACARLAGERSDAELQRMSRDAGRRAGATEDAQEGPRAFLEKRAPVWKGR
jgi:enoyl-CoA hydratase/carnithine racemase